MPTKLELIQDDAISIARWRGHTLETFRRSGKAPMRRATAACKNCGRRIFILETPGEDEKAISGDVITKNCGDIIR